MSQALNCTSTPGEVPAKIGNKKPIVLSSQRYGKLLNTALHSEKQRIQKESEEEQKYREYLKKGSEELVAHFKGIPRTKDQKLEETKEKLKKKTEKAEESYKNLKEWEEKSRREKIAKAEEIIEKLKPGPRELQSAAIQAEVLRVRNVQRNINEEFEKAVKKQECINRYTCNEQALSWVDNGEQHAAECQKNTNNYKKELLQTINENSKHRAEYKKQLIKEQQAAREAMDLEIKAQIEKEKAIMEKKRAALRKNALEAMKMVEQRRLRERMVDELDDRLCCVYNVGKRQLDDMRKEQMKQSNVNREKNSEANTQLLANLAHKTQTQEEERLRRDISRMQLKFTTEEQEKIRKDKAAKQARIEAYLRDMHQLKEAKVRMAEEKRFDMAQRLKNDEVNCLFNEAQKQERLEKTQEMRNQLKAQLEEKKLAEQEKKEKDLECLDNSAIKEDKIFFEYARDLIEDAQKKERPLYPFIKVVQQYKRDRQLNCGERKTPKHLVSQVNVACRQQEECKAKTDGISSKSLRRDTFSPDEKAKILENCIKVTELLAANKVSESNQCEPQWPVECLQNKEPLHKARNDGLGSCASLLSAGYLRYSVKELKKMNQFAPPTADP